MTYRRQLPPRQLPTLPEDEVARHVASLADRTVPLTRPGRVCGGAELTSGDVVVYRGRALGEAARCALVGRRGKPQPQPRRALVSGPARRRCLACCSLVASPEVGAGVPP